MAAPYYTADAVTLHVGDSLGILPTLADASIDTIITDPPYEISFMDRDWDGSGIAYNTKLWAECLRVLKPGGHLAAFGGPRTYHRMACAIEDAGFEIRDSIHWIYGTGFPKGQDIARAIDRRRDDRPEILKVTAWLAAARNAAGWTNAMIDDLFGFAGMAGHWTTDRITAAVPNPEQWDRLREEIGFDDTEIRPLVDRLNSRKGSIGENWAKREVVGTRNAPIRKSEFLYGNFSGDDRVTVPASEAAQRWQGWNTNIKPSHEPIVLARKTTGHNTTVANVLKHGTGALNIDGCRTPGAVPKVVQGVSRAGKDGNAVCGDGKGLGVEGMRSQPHQEGRWPTNVVLTHPPILDEHDQVLGDACADGCADGCPIAEMDQQSGTGKSTRGLRGERSGSVYGKGKGPSGPDGERGYTDEGGASRFFPAFRYASKAPTRERLRLDDGTVHPTVKPLSLMRWLVRLMTPPGGTVLDPFAGSGTTLEACQREGANGVGIERDPRYAELCVKRLGKNASPLSAPAEAAS